MLLYYGELREKKTDPNYFKSLQILWKESACDIGAKKNGCLKD